MEVIDIETDPHIWFGIRVGKLSKFAKGKPNEHLSELLSQNVDEQVGIKSAMAKKTYEDGLGFECALDIPLSELNKLGYKFIQVETHVRPVTVDGSPPDAFTLLMQMSKKYQHLPDKRYIEYKNK